MADDDDFIFLTHAPGSLDDEVAKVKEEIRRELESRQGGTQEGHERYGPARQARHGPARRAPPSGPKAQRPAQRLGPPSRPAAHPSGPASRPPPRKETPIGRREGPGPEPSEPKPPRGATQRLLAGGRAFTERLKVRGQRATLRFHASRRELNETANLEAFKRTFRALRRRPQSPIAGSDVPDVLKDRSAPAPLPTGPQGFASTFPAEYFLGVLRGLSPSVWAGALMLGVLAGAVLYFLAWTPALGLAALALGGSRLLTWRVRFVDEVSKHEGGGTWPNWEAVPASVMVYLGLSLLFVPALVTGISSLGSEVATPAAWDPRDPRSLPGRARVHIGGGGGSGRAFIGAVTDAAETYKDRAWETQDLVDSTRESQGVSITDEENERKRRQAEQAVAALRDLAGEEEEDLEQRDWREVLQERVGALRAWAHEPWTHTRSLLLAALLLFPMGLLVSARLHTAYAVLNPPLLLLSILRTPISYSLVAAVFLVADAFLFSLIWIVPPTLTAALGAGAGPAVAALGIGILSIWACSVSGEVLGRYYRSRSGRLGW